MSATDMQEQFGIFRFDGRFTGYWLQLKFAQENLPKYGPGAVIYRRVATYTEWEPVEVHP
jgi:hypothetical protein